MGVVSSSGKIIHSQNTKAKTIMEKSDPFWCFFSHQKATKFRKCWSYVSSWLANSVLLDSLSIHYYQEICFGPFLKLTVEIEKCFVIWNAPLPADHLSWRCILCEARCSLSMALKAWSLRKSSTNRIESTAHFLLYLATLFLYFFCSKFCHSHTTSNRSRLDSNIHLSFLSKTIIFQAKRSSRTSSTPSSMQIKAWLIAVDYNGGEIALLTQATEYFYGSGKTNQGIISSLIKVFVIMCCLW